jgi:hypothetical protein
VRKYGFKLLNAHLSFLCCVHNYENCALIAICIVMHKKS